MSVPMSNGSVRITWQSPTNSNGRILGYDVTYGPIGGVERTLSVSTESIILTGLGELTFCDGILRMWDMSALIRRCENFGLFYSFCSQLAEASERQM